MLKRFSHFFACLLLVLMPLQSFAAANMAVCNSMMPVNANNQQAAKMSCHQHMADVTKNASTENSSGHKNTCKTTCATLCSSLCAMTALPSNIRPAALQDTSKAMTLLSQSYASITLPSPQRPPRLLS